jgi:PAS domain S-box-containing protein
VGARAATLKAFGDDFAWSLLDAAPDATLVVAGSGEIVFVNDHAGELFGYTLDELLGRAVEDLLPESLRAVHRAHRNRYRAEPTVRSMGTGFELLARRSDWTEFPVEISLSPLRLGDEVFAVAAVRDISQRVEAEEQLRRVLRTLDATDDGVFIFDANTLRYSFVNEGAVRLIGYTRDELLAMTPLHLNPYASETEYRRLVDSLVSDDTSAAVRQTTMLRKDGTEIKVEKTYRSAEAGRDGNRWIIVLARDISARLQTEAELRESHEALRDAEQQVAIARDRERIARDLHDTVIQQLFAEGLSLQAAMANTHDSELTRERMQSTIDGLDEVIRALRLAIFSLQSTHVQPGGLRGRLVAAIAQVSGALGFEPRVQFDGPVGGIAEGIADELVPVLREALSNVARHAQARSARVSITADTNVTLTVSDDGIGVPDEVLGGRGMGNLLERARALGGECSITRQSSGGSLFRWQVPNGVVPS